MLVFKRGKSKNYNVRFMYNGRTVQFSTKQRDKDEALKMGSAELTRLSRVDAGLEAPVPPIAKSKYRTIGSLIDALEADYRLRSILSPQTISHFKRARTDFGKIGARDLTAEGVDLYIEKRLADGDKAATINRTTQLLKQAFGLAVKRHHIARAPEVRHLSEKGNERKGFLNPAQFENVLAALPEELKDFCAWAHATGQRKGEAAKLTWDMVQGDELRIPGDITKNREPRTLPLCGQLAEIIERRRAARQVKRNGMVEISGLIFHRNGEAIREFRKSWKSAIKAAGVAGTRFHDLRRSCARNLTHAGVPREIAKQVTGHLTDSMWYRYNIVVTDDVRAALEKTELYREAAQQRVVAMEASR